LLFSSSFSNVNVGLTHPRSAIPTHSVFTTATRGAVEKLQQQYGLPMTGIWGGLERSVFDTNARVQTAPPASAQALLPPDYNRTTANVYQKAVPAVAARQISPPANRVSSTSMGFASGLAGDVAGIAMCASAGLLTAAVLSKANAKRRQHQTRQPPRGVGGERQPTNARGGAVGSAMNNIVAAVRGLTGSLSSNTPQNGGGGWYDQQGYFHETPPKRAPVTHATGGGDWFAGGQQPLDERDRVEDDIKLFGGYPAPRDGEFSARGPVRPGDRRKQDTVAEHAVPPHARGYHPAFAKGGPAYDPDRVASPPPPPSTPPPAGAGHRGYGSRNAQHPASHVARGYGGWGEDLDVMRSDGQHRDAGQNSARETRRPGHLGASEPAPPMAQGFRSSNGAPEPASRTPASVPPFGDWGGGGGAFGGDSRARAGPAAVPEYGASDSIRGLGATAGMPNLAGGGGGFTGPMAAQSAGTATIAKPEPPSARRKREAEKLKSPGFLGAIGDGLKAIAGAPAGAFDTREQSEFTARAQRERELLAQVEQANEYARVEQKKRQQLEAAYQSTRNALKEAQSAREGLKAQENVRKEMDTKMKELERTLSNTAPSAFSGDATGGLLATRVAALENALAAAASGATGGGVAAAAMSHLQEKVKALEVAFSSRNASADAFTSAVAKVEKLAAQVAKDAAGVPELQRQMHALQAAVAKTPSAAAAGGTMAVNANLQEVTERMVALEQSLEHLRANPASLDVLFAKVSAVEEGLAATANGSSAKINELQRKINTLDVSPAPPGAWGNTPVQAPGVNNVVTAFPPGGTKKKPNPPPGFKPPLPPASTPTPLPNFAPAIQIKNVNAAPASATPPSWGVSAQSAGAPESVQNNTVRDTSKLGADYKIEEGTLPRIATGREVMMQGFNWESHKFDWYKLVGDRAQEISDIGVTQIWLPPCTDSLAPEGYLPRDLSSLNSKYGDEQGLRGLIGTLRSKNILPVLDAVLNHRCATHRGAGEKWNKWEGCGFMDWGEWAVTNTQPDFAGQGGGATGDEFHGAPNIDHRNDKVQDSICKWMTWMMDDVGFGGVRFDFSKGYGGEFAGQYTRACMPEFAVGEYWDTLNYGEGLEYDQDDHRQRIVNWIDETGGIATAFDFTTKGILQEACGKSEFWRLVDKKGRAPGVIGLWPGRAVTFLDNHDTGSTQSHWPFPSNKVGMGYAYILTHPGTPSVFWDHYFDWGDDLKKQIAGLLKTRDDAGIHSRSKLEIVAATDNLYAAHVGDRLAVKLGGDWAPSGAGWEKAVSGDGWCVWIKN
jgi:alpha-amylase